MKKTEDVRKYAAEQGVAQNEARAKGMAAKPKSSPRTRRRGLLDARLILAKPNRTRDASDMFTTDIIVESRFSPDATAVVFPGDCLELLAIIPDEAVQLFGV